MAVDSLNVQVSVVILVTRLVSPAPLVTVGTIEKAGQRQEQSVDFVSTLLQRRASVRGCAAGGGSLFLLT